MNLSWPVFLSACLPRLHCALVPAFTAPAATRPLLRLPATRTTSSTKWLSPRTAPPSPARDPLSLSLPLVPTLLPLLAWLLLSNLLLLLPPLLPQPLSTTKDQLLLWLLLLPQLPRQQPQRQRQHTSRWFRLSLLPGNTTTTSLPPTRPLTSRTMTATSAAPATRLFRGPPACASTPTATRARSPSAAPTLAVERRSLCAATWSVMSAVVTPVVLLRLWFKNNHQKKIKKRKKNPTSKSALIHIYIHIHTPSIPAFYLLFLTFYFDSWWYPCFVWLFREVLWIFFTLRVYIFYFYFYFYLHLIWKAISLDEPRGGKRVHMSPKDFGTGEMIWWSYFFVWFFLCLISIDIYQLMCHDFFSTLWSL